MEDFTYGTVQLSGSISVERWMDNGVHNIYEYTSDNRIQSVRNYSDFNVVINHHHYAYDELGNLTSRQDCDVLDTTVSCLDGDNPHTWEWQKSYTYDAMGRLQTITDDFTASVIEAYTYDAAQQLQSIDPARRRWTPC